MAINKVVYQGDTLMDITDSTVTPESLNAGVIAYAANGEKIVGTGSSTAPSDWLASEGEAGYVKNRTHYEEVTEVGGDTLTWDGNTEGLESPMFGYYKVSDIAITLDDLVNGCTVTVVAGGQSAAITVDYEMLAMAYETFGAVTVLDDNSIYALSIAADGFETGGAVFSKGTYLVSMDGALYVSELTIPGYTGFKTTTTTVKTLDPKYLPEALQFGEKKAFEPIVWDGNTEGLESIETGEGMYAYKIADYIDGTQIESVTMKLVTANGDTQELQGVVTQMDNGWVEYQGMMFGCNGEAGTFTFPQGVWHIDPAVANAAEYSITINPKNIIQPFDVKYLPEGFPYKENTEKVLFEADFELTADSNGLMTGTVEGTTLAQDLTVGKPYKFIVNDRVYENVVGKEYTASGSGGIVFVEMLYGFRCWAFSDGDVKFEDSNGVFDAVTLVITEPAVIYRPIPEECLPDTIARVSDVEDMINGSGGEASAPNIVDVLELPVDDIDENVFYRVLRATNVTQGGAAGGTCYIVDGLPETGEPLTDGQSYKATYYNAIDKDAYGYLPSQIAQAIGISSGWYRLSEIAPTFGIHWRGVISDIDDCPVEDGNNMGILLEGVLWHYSYGWKMINNNGRDGTGLLSVVSNSPLNKANGSYSHAEGYSTTASSSNSHAEGQSTTASGVNSHAEGQSTTANGVNSHAEGEFATASGRGSHAEGESTDAIGEYSHAEGYRSEAEGDYSHAEGGGSRAVGEGSHAEGSSDAVGHYSHAEGIQTRAHGEAQHVQGKYNIPDEANIYAHIVGNGMPGGDIYRSNAHTLDWDGNAWYAGTVECTAVIHTSPSGKKFKLAVDDSGTLSAVEVTE